MISTNIAETSITIEDCVFVVEVGKMKEKWFDPNKNMESLGMRSRRIHFCFKMFHETNVARNSLKSTTAVGSKSFATSYPNLKTGKRKKLKFSFENM